MLFEALDTKDTVGSVIQDRFEKNARPMCVVSSPIYKIHCWLRDSTQIRIQCTRELYQSLDTKDTVGCLIQRRFE